MRDSEDVATGLVLDAAGWSRPAPALGWHQLPPGAAAIPEPLYHSGVGGGRRGAGEASPTSAQRACVTGRGEGGRSPGQGGGRGNMAEAPPRPGLLSAEQAPLSLLPRRHCSASAWIHFCLFFILRPAGDSGSCWHLTQVLLLLENSQPLSEHCFLHVLHILLELLRLS